MFFLKRTTSVSKGIVVFTHKELSALKILNFLAPNALRILREKFFFFVHWGHYSEVDKLPSFIDLNLAGQGTLKYLAPISTPVLNLCSRNFVPGIFSPRVQIPKRWDVIMIARPLKLKGIDLFLEAIQLNFDRKKRFRYLLICPFPETLDGDDYQGLEEEIAAMPSELREQLDFFPLRAGSSNPFPLSQDLIAFFMHQSRALALLSDKEGESRVISEALVAEIPVIARKDLKGGGLDYLNESNSVLISDAVSLADAIETASMLRCPAPPKELLEKDSTKKLDACVRGFFKDKGEVFEGELRLASLDRALCSHLREIPREYCAKSTDDILCPNLLLKYFFENGFCDVSLGQRILVRALAPIAQKMVVFRKFKFIRNFAS